MCVFWTHGVYQAVVTLVDVVLKVLLFVKLLITILRTGIECTEYYRITEHYYCS